MPSTYPYLLMAGSFLNSVDSLFNNTEDWKRRILAEWEESKSLPRKAKKRKRKELNLDWSIACYDPFDIMGI